MSSKAEQEVEGRLPCAAVRKAPVLDYALGCVREWAYWKMCINPPQADVRSALVEELLSGDPDALALQQLLLHVHWYGRPMARFLYTRQDGTTLDGLGMEPQYLAFLRKLGRRFASYCAEDTNERNTTDPVEGISDVETPQSSTVPKEGFSTVKQVGEE